MASKQAIVHRFCDEVFSKTTESRLHELLHFTFTARFHTGHTMKRTEFLQFIGQVWKSFSHLQFRTEDSISDGAKVAVRGTVSGVHEECFYRLPATAKSFSMPGQGFFDFVDNQISGLWIMVDQQKWMRQLGLWKVSEETAAESHERGWKGMEQPSAAHASEASQADWNCILLSERELDIIRLVAHGCTSKKIGVHLHLSPRTVEKYEEHIRLKLRVPNRAGVIAWAIRSGVMDA
ncbi:hypothetical protein PAESOLCIP111_04288 [Paenibacillus solanacearum]|uniref:HTH luxR-type domain-containing protein n=1 Tax=Paenibacillus solanacearum TaxID=2048548 RepID=A0A916K4F1_9BACL|nr:ester cyclase [Paenibacillus solanacearum]CAG7641960.1 hypothetical protein PAESOLCIP111_04288 [Paenibacillus solanacearum]